MKYLIGRPRTMGRLLSVGQFKEFSKDEFYEMIEQQIVKFRLVEHRKEALKKSNLKRVVTIGDLSFKIEK